jgi:hypothetical protein
MRYGYTWLQECQAMIAWMATRNGNLVYFHGISSERWRMKEILKERAVTDPVVGELKIVKVELTVIERRKR